MTASLRALLTPIAILALAALAGCATPPQQPIPLQADAFTAKPGRVGVAMTALPAVDTSLPGADCLLCIAVASAANSGLTAHARKLPVEDLPKLKDAVAAALKKRGAEVTVIADPIDLGALPKPAAAAEGKADKDFTTLRSKLGVDKLVVIAVDLLGFERTYAAYVPTSDPKAVFRGRGFLVNLESNAYQWYLPVNVLKSADGPWDEPPQFPGLTNAYFQALEIGKDQIVEGVSK